MDVLRALEMPGLIGRLAMDAGDRGTGRRSAGGWSPLWGSREHEGECCAARGRTTAAGSLILAHGRVNLCSRAREGACLPGSVSEDSMVAKEMLLTRMLGSGCGLGNGRP
jgi:hypothetical protein